MKVCMWIVRNHPEMVGGFAEGYLVAFEFDMGRYADILLNVLLGLLILYFPGGYTHTLFFGMFFSHIVIYSFDHWKVIRNIPRCNYSSMDVDWWATWMLVPCTAIILSCMVFKANCQGYGYCITGNTIVLTCTAAYMTHMVVHT